MQAGGGGGGEREPPDQLHAGDIRRGRRLLGGHYRGGEELRLRGLPAPGGGDRRARRPAGGRDGRRAGPDEASDGLVLRLPHPPVLHLHGPHDGRAPARLSHRHGQRPGLRLHAAAADPAHHVSQRQVLQGGLQDPVPGRSQHGLPHRRGLHGRRGLRRVRHLPDRLRPGPWGRGSGGEVPHGPVLRIRRYDPHPHHPGQVPGDPVQGQDQPGHHPADGSGPQDRPGPPGGRGDGNPRGGGPGGGPDRGPARSGHPRGRHGGGGGLGGGRERPHRREPACGQGARGQGGRRIHQQVRLLCV